MKHLFTYALLFFSFGAFSQDSLSISGSPVKINSVRAVPLEVQGEKQIEIDFTNISKQTIKNVKFRWLEESSAGYASNPEVQTGDITDIYKPGRHGYAKFGTDNSNLQKLKYIVAYEVTFESGFVWAIPLNPITPKMSP